MSGVCAHIAARGEADGESIDAVLTALAHRGPDGAGALADGPCRLGHLWLRTGARDAPGPVRLAPDGPALSGDLRLDDADGLADALGLPRSTPDALLALHAYGRWGDDFPARLDGEFALVVWDPARRRLLCARDRFGVKPLAWAAVPGGVVVASEPGALLAVLPSTPEPDPVWIAEYLTGHASSAARTAHREISRLEPGSTLVTDGREVRISRWFTLEVEEARADAPEALREALARAVSAHGREMPVAAMLSGGLDSSAVARLAARAEPARALPVYSMLFDDLPGVDESAFIAAVVETGGFDPRAVRPASTGAFADVPAILALHGAPPGAMGPASGGALHAAVAADGLRILLSGHGGDEVVSDGLSHLATLAAAGRWGRVWHGTGGASALYGQPRGDLLLALAATHAPRPLGGLARRLRRGRSPDPRAWRRIVHADAARRTDLVERRRQAQPVPVPGLPPEAVAHIAALTGPRVPEAFESLDRVAARHGVEMRYPFFDRRVVGICLAAPPEAKLVGGTTRALLRDAMRGILPDAVRLRPGKADFLPLVLRGLAEPGARALIDALLADPEPIADHVDLGVLRHAVERLRAGAGDFATAREIWCALWLWLWLRAGASAAVPQPVGSTLAVAAP